MDFISIQFDKENRLTAILVGNAASQIPTDDKFPEGYYQRIYMEQGDARAYIQLGYKPPKFFHKMTYSEMAELKKRVR